MASLYVTEYAQISRQGVGVGAAQAPQEPPLAEQKLTIGATAVLSSTFSTYTRLVRLHADAVCSVVFGGASVTATAANQRVAIGVSEYHGIPDKGVVTNLSVITNS
jgi:hypothetical protein